MIKRIIKDCLTHYKNNPFFRKTVILYVLTGCIIFFLFGIVTTFIISGTSMAQRNATEQKMLAQSCNTANLILRDIHSLANYEFTEDSAIREAMTEPYSVSISQKVQSAFSDMMAASSLIDSIYVMNFTNDVIYSTQTNAKTSSDFFDANIMEYLTQNPAKSDIFFSRSANLTFDPTNNAHVNYITSVYRTSRDFAFVVNIDQNTFQELVNLTSDRDSYITAVLDSTGFVISHSNPEFFAKNMSDDPLYQRILNSHLDSESFRRGGAIVNYVRSNTLGYTYLSISNAGNHLSGLGAQLLYMLLFTVFLVLVYFVCSMFASLNTYALYNNLKKNIYRLFNKEDSEEATDDELEHITSMLDEVKNRYSSMETIQHQYINTKQNATLKKLLTGVFAYLQDDMEACRITFPYSGYAVVVCNIDNMSKMDSDTIYMIKYAIMNMGKEIFENHAKTYVSEVNEYDAEFILNYMSDNSFIEPAVKKLNSYMEEFFQATVSTAYDCTVSDSMEDISVLYHNAKHALPYRLMKGHAAIIAYQDIMELDNTISTYPEELEQAIIKSIPAQNEEELSSSVDKFVQSLSHSSFNMVLLYIDRLLLAIDQFSIRSGMSDTADDMAGNVQKIVAELETMEEIERYILSKCRNLMLKFSNTKFDSKKDIMVKSVLDYIEKNYTDPNLSIDMIASEINRSANYTRGMFKQSQGISISDYIANKRFDEVCRLLVETNLTAQEIGASLGLNSGSYFYTSFKKHTGYTPDQYRKLHHKTVND